MNEPAAPNHHASVDELTERHRCGSIAVGVASAAEYAEVEAFARLAEPSEVFSPLTAGLLSWFLDRNPTGRGFLVLARSATDGAVAGHFLFYRTTLVRRTPQGDLQLPASLYVHLFVAPRFRRQGVFRSMLGFGLEVLAGSGVSFAYTVPNPRSTPGFAGHSIPRLGTLPCWMAPSWPAWQGLFGMGAPARRALAVDRVDDFAGVTIPGDADVASEVRGVRTRRWLDWRFRDRPGADYAIWRVSGRDGPEGYAVTRILTIRRYRVAVICDLALARFDAEALHGVLSAIRKSTAAERPDLLMLQGGPPGSAARLALWRCGLARVPDRLLPQPVVVFGGAPGLPASTGGLPLLNRWRLTPADWDVF